MTWKRRTSLAALLIVGLMLPLFLSSAVAYASTPEEVVKERTEALAAVLARAGSPERTEKLAREIEKTLDFEYLAARAFGEHWEVRSQAEQEEFLNLLQRLLEANYSRRLGDHRLESDYRIEYGEPRVRRDRAFVRAVVSHRDRSEEVVYRLHRDGGEWKIYDVVIDDISLEETYREGYVPIIEEEGWEELISLMRERLEELEAH